MPSVISPLPDYNLHEATEYRCIYIQCNKYVVSFTKKGKRVRQSFNDLPEALKWACAKLKKTPAQLKAEKKNYNPQAATGPKHANK